MREKGEKILPENLRELAAVDMQTVDPEKLVDIDSVEIRKDLPIPERVNDFIEKIKNPSDLNKKIMSLLHFCFLFPYSGLVINWEIQYNITH